MGKKKAKEKVIDIHELSFNNLHISPSEIYSQLGYGDAVPDNNVVSEMVEILKRIKEILMPKFCFFIANGVLDTEENTLSVAGLTQGDNKETTFDIGRIIAHQLYGSSTFAFFIATAGMEFQHFLEELKRENDMVKLFIADAIGSVIAEKTADCMEEELQNSIESCGWKHTNRYSPGYCGWHVSQQHLLFPLFGNGAPCGVTLTESSLMYPIKSVSGVIGIGANVKKLPYSCGLCDMKTCYKRRKQAISLLAMPTRSPKSQD